MVKMTCRTYISSRSTNSEQANIQNVTLYIVYLKYNFTNNWTHVDFNYLNECKQIRSQA